MVRINVMFYNCFNGHSTLIGTGKEITLGNGNVYAIIDNTTYQVVSDDCDSNLILIS